MGETKRKKATEFERFDDALGRILSVSHDGLKRREVEWKKQKERKRKKRAKMP